MKNSKSYQRSSKNHFDDSYAEVFYKRIKKIESQFLFRIFSLFSLKTMLQETGYKNIVFYQDYTFVEGNESSKNLIVIAQH